MQRTTTFISASTLAVLALPMGITSLAIAGPPDGVLEISRVRGYATSITSCWEFINEQEDDCLQSWGAAAIGEMPVDSDCSVWVETPSDNFEQLLSWAGGDAHAEVNGFELDTDEIEGFLLFGDVSASLDADDNSEAAARSSAYFNAEFDLNERAVVQIETCFDLGTNSGVFIEFVNLDTGEVEIEPWYAYALEPFGDCYDWTFELPAGRYRLLAEVFSEIDGQGSRETAAEFGIGLGARTLTLVERADINRDGIVDGADLVKVLGYWGSNEDQVDVNQDGIVDGGDLLVVLAHWNQITIF